MILVVLLTLLTIGGSLWPSPGPPLVDHIDKLEHLTAYAVLALVYLGYFRRAGRAVGLSLGLGFLLEVLQIAVPGRYFSLADLAANAIGVAIGVMGYARRDIRYRVDRLLERCRSGLVTGSD